MGIAILFEKNQKTNDKKHFKISARCFLEELSHPEDSTASILIEDLSESNLSIIHKYELLIQLSEFSDKWIERWFDAFCLIPDYRDKFIIKDESCDCFYIQPERIDVKTGEIVRQSTLPVVPMLPLDVSAKKTSGAVHKLVKLGKRAKFKDFAALRSGRDAFSSLKLPAILESIGGDSEKLLSIDIDDENKLKIGRWMLRGLPLDLAIHKVKVDLEIGQNSHRSK